jgi:hypothetical protein
MTVYLHESAPLGECTVDLTPRHCQKFRPAPAAKFQWANTSLADKKLVQSGQAAADPFGLVTLEKLLVTKTRHRIRIAR